MTFAADLFDGLFLQDLFMIGSARNATVFCAIRMPPVLEVRSVMPSPTLKTPRRISSGLRP
ncbi:MAG: hypothetical protein H7327_00070 [Herminiimonas sp.]|nr:hypothetical protein [Herminiimonas sp.]